MNIIEKVDRYIAITGDDPEKSKAHFMRTMLLELNHLEQTLADTANDADFRKQEDLIVKIRRDLETLKAHKFNQQPT